MVAKGTKRKVTEVDVVAEKCKDLSKAITEAANLPTDVITMLVEVLPHSLGQPKDKRHRFQEQAVLAVDNVMQGIEDTLKKNIEEARTKLLEAKNQAAPSESAVANAEQKLRQDSDSFTSETKTLAESALAFRAARNAVEEAKKAQESGDQELKDAAKKKDKLQVMIDDLIVPLKNGTVEEAAMEKSCKSLISALKNLEMDEAILLVLGSAFAKAPAKRGDFDTLAIEQLDKVMAKHIAPLDQTLQAGEAGREQRANGVKEAQKALDEATQAQKGRADVFESVWTAKKEDEVALQASRTGLKDLAAQTKSCDKATYAAEADFDVFQEFARKTFNELKERTTPEPVVEPVVEPEKPVEPQNIPMEVSEGAALEAAVVLPEAITA